MAIPRWWTRMERSTIAVTVQNDEIAPATVTAIRPRDWHGAVEKVEENSYNTALREPNLQKVSYDW